MKKPLMRTTTGLVLGFLFWYGFMYAPPYYISVALASICIYIIIYEWPRLYNKAYGYAWLITPFYPCMPFALSICLNQEPTQRILFFILILLVASHDIGSYIVGSCFGRHAIAPQISPGKTWEGFLGGFFFTTISLTLFLWNYGGLRPGWIIISVACIVSILAFAGDLFESWLKRQAHVKDTGQALPGHGGFLDRFDSILFVAYFFYTFRSFLIAFLNLYGHS